MVKFGTFLLVLTLFVSMVFIGCSDNLGEANGADGASFATGTLVIGGGESRAIEVNTIKAADIAVQSDDMSPITKQGLSVSSGRGSVTIERIPVGKNRIISVSAKDTDGTAISGGIMYAVTDIVPGVNRIATITWKTSRKGIVYNGLLSGGVSISALSDGDAAKINAAIPDNCSPEDILVEKFVEDWKNGKSLKDKSEYVGKAEEKLSYIELTNLGGGNQLIATAHYTDSTEKDVSDNATWESSNKAAATVSRGAITLVGAGETTVTATYGGKTSNRASVKVSSSSGKIYLVPNSNWTQANAWFAGYVYDGKENNGWMKFAKSDSGSGMYEADLPAGNWTHIIFLRMKNTATTPNWDDVWNRTPADGKPGIAFEDGKNTYTLNNGWDDCGGTWSSTASSGGTLSATITLDEVVPPAKPVVTISSTNVKLNGKITITVKSATAVSGSVKIGGVTKNLSIGENTFAVSEFTSTAGTLSVTGSVENDMGVTQISETITVTEGVASGDMPTEWDELRIYQVMVSSFQDGDPSIGYSQAYGPSGALTGGDLRGVINALDYIKGLGMNALWMTPIFDSTKSTNTYLNSTGYFTYNYFDIDPNFGNKQVFAELVEKAHEKGIAIILDGVFGHWGDAGVAASPSGKMPVRNNGQYKACAYPASLDFFNEVASYWITDYKIDGWRFDQCYQVGLGDNGNGDGDNCYTGGHNYWYDIRTTIKNAAKKNGDFGTAWGTLGYTVGEHWKGDATLIQKGSVDKGNAAGYGLQSCFDFPARYQLIQSLAIEESKEEKGPNLSGAITYTMKTSSEKGYVHDEGYHPNLFVTNHDLVRLGNLLNWKFSCSPTSNSDLYFGKHKVAMAIVGAYSGPITVYYGDEWGAYVDGYSGPGSLGAYNDNVARSTGKISGFNGNEQGVIDFTTGVMNARATHPALWKGRNETVVANGDIYVGRKTYEGETITYIINGSGSAYSHSASGTDLITGNAYTGSCPAYSAVYILNK